MSKEKFLRGALILTMAGLLVKVFGSVNRILLSRLLGGEGIGLYQMAYPVYLLLLAVSAAGIPVAISIMVSGYLARGDYGNVRRILRVSLLLMTVVGVVLASLLAIGADLIVTGGIISDQRVYFALLALVPAVLLGTVLASLRGYFQGHQLMLPTAVSQIVEQFVRVTAMLLLAYALLPRGLEYAAAGAALGTVPGSAAGLVVLIIFYYKHSRSTSYEKYQPLDTVATGALLKRLLLLALPVSCANVLVPVTGSIDMLLVPNRLIACGYTVAEATTLFGYLAGMAQPLILMATIPTASLAASLVPAISEEHILRNADAIGKKSAAAMKICCLITVPAAVGMTCSGELLSPLLYGTGKAAAAITHSGPAIWLLGMQQVTACMLQGIGHIYLPMLNMLAGLLAKVVCVLLLTDAERNIIGAAWATNINFGLAAALNIWALMNYGIRFRWGEVTKIFTAALLMGATVICLLSMTAGAGLLKSAAVIFTAAVIIYIVSLFILGVIGKEELLKFPLLNRIFRRK